MLINICDDSSILAEAARTMKQIESRTWEMIYNESMLNGLQLNQDLKNEIVDIVNSYKGVSRQYSSVGGCSCDNVAILEALGIGAYAKKYSVVVDFSEQLALILNRVCKSNIENIKSIKNYLEISKAILNTNFNDLADYKFSSFLGIDANLDKYIIETLKKLTLESNDKVNIGLQFVEKFYMDILNELEYLKGYCLIAFKKEHKFVIRSKTYSSVILTSDSIIDDSIQIVDECNNCIANIPVKCYERLQYIREVVK